MNEAVTNFPLDIKLSNPPLIEAWLEMQWKLEEVDAPATVSDPGYAFALGTFYDRIKGDFPLREKLPAADAPENLLPYVVRYRFRVGEDEWPVLQIGPGAATVNFVDSYTWSDFLDRALYLRKEICAAYSDPIEAKALRLRYRNAVALDYDSVSVLEFLNDKLNTSVKLPTGIPGSTNPTGLAKSFVIDAAFDLVKPPGTGRLTFRTATRNEDSKEEKFLLWELAVFSEDEQVPDFGNEKEFRTWLETAHDQVIHEWFFSTIEGVLRREYE